MDKSLDEIIASKPKGVRRSSRRGSARVAARAQVLGRPAPPPGQRARATAVAAPAPEGGKADKIIVSNLPPDVNEAQIKDFFNQTVGPVKEVLLSYDAAGRSKGVATVTFTKKGDGNKAFQSYNNRLIDGS
jgi:THO complex subunit 4